MAARLCPLQGVWSAAEMTISRRWVIRTVFSGLESAGRNLCLSLSQNPLTNRG